MKLKYLLISFKDCLVIIPQMPFYSKKEGVVCLLGLQPREKHARLPHPAGAAGLIVFLPKLSDSIMKKLLIR